MTPGLGAEFYGRVKEGVVAAVAGYGADQAHEVTIQSARLEGEDGDISLVLTFRWDRHPETVFKTRLFITPDAIELTNGPEDVLGSEIELAVVSVQERLALYRPDRPSSEAPVWI